MSDTGPQVKIGWPLFNATKIALEKFRMHLPKGALQPAVTDDAAKADDAFIREWAAALSGISLDAIIDAASRWLRDEEHLDDKGRTRIPTIAAFARYARKVDFDHFRPPLTLTEQRPKSLPGRIHELTVRATRSLGSEELAREVWTVLWKNALPGAQAQAVREGRVTDDEFDVAIAIVRESDRLAKAKRPA